MCHPQQQLHYQLRSSREPCATPKLAAAGHHAAILDWRLLGGVRRNVTCARLSAPAISTCACSQRQHHVKFSFQPSVTCAVEQHSVSATHGLRQRANQQPSSDDVGTAAVMMMQSQLQQFQQQLNLSTTQSQRSGDHAHHSNSARETTTSDDSNKDVPCGPAAIAES
jgi:hypothetical protein